MNNGENKDKPFSIYKFYPPPLGRHNEEGKFCRIDKEQCEKAPLKQWYEIYTSTCELRRHTLVTMKNRQQLINWLNDREKRRGIRNEQIERLQQLDIIIDEFYKKIKELDSLEEKLFWFLPHEVS